MFRSFYCLLYLTRLFYLTCEIPFIDNHLEKRYRLMDNFIQLPHSYQTFAVAAFENKHRQSLINYDNNNSSIKAIDLREISMSIPEFILIFQ